MTGHVERKYTPELDALEDEYLKMFGCLPETYIQVCYDAMTYETYIKCIRKALKKKKELPYIRGAALY